MPLNALEYINLERVAMVQRKRFLNCMLLLAHGHRIELLIQQLFLGICANAGLTIYGGDATDAYAHSPAPNDTYLQVDDAYAEWYKNKTNETISKRMVLPVKHALQGHPKSGKI